MIAAGVLAVCERHQPESTVVYQSVYRAWPISFVILTLSKARGRILPLRFAPSQDDDLLRNLRTWICLASLYGLQVSAGYWAYL